MTPDGRSRLVIARPKRPPYDAEFSRALDARLTAIATASPRRASSLMRGQILILVEKHTGVEAAARSVAAAASTGLEVWATVEGAAGVRGDADGPGLGDGSADARGGVDGPARGAPGSAGPPAAFDGEVERFAVHGERSIGVLLPRAVSDLATDRLRRWLRAGAGVLGLAEGAFPESCAPFARRSTRSSEARDAAREGSEKERCRGEPGCVMALRVARGTALWLGDAGSAAGVASHRLCVTHAGTGSSGRLPAGGYRLVVADEKAELRDIVRILDEDGVLALAATRRGWVARASTAPRSSMSSTDGPVDDGGAPPRPVAALCSLNASIVTTTQQPSRPARTGPETRGPQRRFGAVPTTNEVGRTPCTSSVVSDIRGAATRNPSADRLYG